MRQWSGYNIDITTPDKNTNETKIAGDVYAKKLVKVNYNDTKL